MSNLATPVPYQPGNSLQLQVLRNCCDLPFSQSVTATISKTFDMTMSPVMDVTINTESGSNVRAILKLYDRRFGQYVQDGLEREPHTAASEEVFRTFVRQGGMDFSCPDQDMIEKADITIPRFHDRTLKRNAMYEGRQWKYCNEFFDCETEAYARLSDLQGKSIPRMYAHVRLEQPSSDLPADLLQPQTARYFEVKGILLEFIPGYTLCNLATSPLVPPDQWGVWPATVKSAVDAVHNINRCGVIMTNFETRNVLVHEHSQSPIIVDLAQCVFKDWFIEICEDMDPDDEEWEDIDSDDEGQDLDPYIWYWNTAKKYDNTGEIGVEMSKILLRAGMRLKLKCPAGSCKDAGKVGRSGTEDAHSKDS